MCRGCLRYFLQLNLEDPFPEKQHTPFVIAHFARWGLEVHVGSDGKASKSEVLFSAKPSACYQDPASFDGADLSDVQLPNGMSMPIVDRFVYLGDMVSRDGSDALAVAARVQAGSRAWLSRSVPSECSYTASGRGAKKPGYFR